MVSLSKAITKKIKDKQGDISEDEVNGFESLNQVFMFCILCHILLVDN